MVVSSPPGVKLQNLLHINEFQTSAPHCPTPYSPAGNDDMLDIVEHKNVWSSEFIVSDTVDSDHLPVVFHLLNHIRTRNLSDLVDIFTDWERFQSLASELISHRIQISSRE
jgi:hypothetical protein